MRGKLKTPFGQQTSWAAGLVDNGDQPKKAALVDVLSNGVKVLIVLRWPGRVVGPGQQGSVGQT